MDEVTLDAEKLLAGMKPPKPSVEQGASLLPRGNKVEITVSNGSVSVWRTATPTTLLVHGWNDDHRVWRKLIEHFTFSHKSIALMDLPGHGASQTPDYTYPFAGEAIRRVCKETGPIDTIVAHSFGCIAAIRAIECGAEIKSFVLIAPSIPDLDRGWLSYHRKKGVSNAILTKAAQIFEARYGIPLKPYDAAAAIENFKGRLLIIASENDEVCSMASIEQFVQTLPNAEFAKVEQMSHRDITASRQVFRLIDSFLM